MVVIDECLRILRAELEGGWPWGRRVTFKEFDACGVPHFFLSRDPIISMRWIVAESPSRSLMLMDCQCQICHNVLCNKARD